MSNKIIKCLCGAEPIVEKDNSGAIKLFKYRCPNCKEKELPWIGQWRDTGALQEWNSIAQMEIYHKRTLEYNECGCCTAEPSEVLEWSDKKKWADHVTFDIFMDNGQFYYRWDWGYKNEGAGTGLSIDAVGFPTIELLKADIKRVFGKHKVIGHIVQKLIPDIIQNELF
jgi:hypothetical protein